MLPSPEFVYKVAPAADYSAAEPSGVFTGMGIDLSDGFIHFSTAAQLSETLRRHFRGQGDLLIIAVRLAELGSELRWEPSRGGELFPHLYGPMPLSAVAWTAPIAVGTDGTCALPESVR